GRVGRRVGGGRHRRRNSDARGRCKNSRKQPHGRLPDHYWEAPSCPPHGKDTRREMASRGNSRLSSRVNSTFVPPVTAPTPSLAKTQRLPIQRLRGIHRPSPFAPFGTSACRTQRADRLASGRRAPAE